MRSRERREGKDSVKTSEVGGIIPPVITPTNNDVEQSVNYAELRNQVNRLLADGVHDTFPVGTSGEAYALSLAEHEEIFTTVIDETHDKVPVYADTGCITTADTIYLSKRAEELGVDALSVVAPSFALASQEELYDHYAVVAKEVHIPIILCNVPARTGNKLLPETVQVLCRDIDVIVGAGDSSGDLENLKAYIRLTKELSKEVAILAGSDGATPACLKEGGADGIAGCTNIWPKTLTSIYDKWVAGGVAGAEQAQEVISALQNILRHGSPNTIIKTAVELLGYPVGKCHASLSYVPEEGIEALQELLSRNEVLDLA